VQRLSQLDQMQDALHFINLAQQLQQLLYLMEERLPYQLLAHQDRQLFMKWEYIALQQDQFIYYIDNMSYLNTLKKYRLTESAEPEDNFDLVDKEDEIEEISTSAGAGAYLTPNAFGGADDDTIEMLGYKKVKKVKKEVKESTFKKLSSEMFLESSYTDYKKDIKSTPKAKINQSIAEINRGLRFIEKIVDHNVRLKQESNVDNTIYWKSSRENLNKINERLVRLSRQLKELGS